MNPKLLRRLLVSAVAVGAFAGLYYYTHAPLLRIRLKDGTEIRVLKVAYGTGANREHELSPPSRLKLRLAGLLPLRWQSYFDSLSNAPLPDLVFPEPMISIWCAYNLPPTSAEQAPSASGALIQVKTRYWAFHLINPAFRSGPYTFGNMDPSELIYHLAPNIPDLLVFQRPPEPAKTLTVNFILNGEPVTFTVPIPAPSE